jgi:hypothetical protein
MGGHGMTLEGARAFRKNVLNLTRTKVTGWLSEIEV